MATESLALILGMSAVIVSVIIIAIIIWVNKFIDSIENGKRLPGAINVSDCDCDMKTVEPDNKVSFNDWAKRYVRPFSNAKPKR